MGAIIRESPVVAAAIAILAAVLVFLVIAIVGGRRRSPRSQPRRPGRQPYARDDLDRDYGRHHYADRVDEGRRRRGFSFGGLAIAFLAGIAVGFGGLKLWPEVPVAAAIDTVFNLIETSIAREQVSSTAPAEPPAPKGTAKASQPAASAAYVAPAGDVEARLARFVGNLQDGLPKQVGPTTSLATVDAAGHVVTLGYNITTVLSDDETSRFQGSLKDTVKGIFCGGKAKEVRYLNDNGIEFRLIYIDQIGKTVGKLAASPGFCAQG
jgi:hypothetical protein